MCDDRQTQILGPVLFNVFINYLNARVEFTISKFAVDTNLGGALGSPGRPEALQRGLDRFEHSANIIGMKSKTKCQILDLGSRCRSS